MKQIGTFPEEPDVTKTSETRVQEMMERLQPRPNSPSSPDIPIHNDIPPTKIEELTVIDTIGPNHMNNLRNKLLSQLKKESEGNNPS